jgi:hypothetical protein
MDVGIDAKNVRQRHCIGVVGLRAGHRVPLSVTCHSHRVDRENRPSRAT